MITVMTGAPSAWSGADHADAQRLVGPDRQEGVEETASGTRALASATASSTPIGVAPRIGSTRAWNIAARMSRPGHTALTAAEICCGKAR